MPLASVVILNLNKKQLLDSCLESLKRQSFRDFEVLVVDNGSTDGSCELIQDKHPEVRFIGLETNIGFSAANNLGIRASTGSFIALLNNDTEADSKWLEEIHKPLLRDGAVGFCASKMIFYNARNVINSAGQDFLSIGRGKDRGWMELDRHQYDHPELVFGACAGAALYRKSMLDDIGLFDEDFSPIYFEDVDLSFRAQLAGWRCLYVSEAIVYHHARGTFGPSHPKTVYLGERNSMYVVLKNMPARLIFKHALHMFLFSFAVAVVRILEGYGASCFAGRFAAFRKFGCMLRKRRQIQAKKRVSTAYVDCLISKMGFISVLAWGLRDRRGRRNFGQSK